MLAIFRRYELLLGVLLGVAMLAVGTTLISSPPVAQVTHSQLPSDAPAKGASPVSDAQKDDLNLKNKIELGLKSVEVLFIAGASGVFLAWNRDRRERRQLLLQERDDVRKERMQHLNEREDIRKEWQLISQQRQTAWEQAFKLSKQTLDALDTIAVHVADEYYRPLIDAVMRVQVYADTYKIIEDTITGAAYLKNNQSLPPDTAETAKDHLLGDGRQKLDEIVADWPEFLDGNADILAICLRDLRTSVAKLLEAGHTSDLEGSIPPQCMKSLLNIYYDGTVLKLGEKPKALDMSSFLRQFRQRELKDLEEIRTTVSWEKFCVQYRNKLRTALGPGL